MGRVADTGQPRVVARADREVGRAKAARRHSRDLAGAERDAEERAVTEAVRANPERSVAHSEPGRREADTNATDDAVRARVDLHDRAVAVVVGPYVTPV